VRIFERRLWTCSVCRTERALDRQRDEYDIVEPWPLVPGGWVRIARGYDSKYYTGHVEVGYVDYCEECWAGKLRPEEETKDAPPKLP